MTDLILAGLERAILWINDVVLGGSDRLTAAAHHVRAARLRRHFS